MGRRSAVNNGEGDNVGKASSQLGLVHHLAATLFGVELQNQRLYSPATSEIGTAHNGTKPSAETA